MHSYEVNGCSVDNNFFLNLREGRSVLNSVYNRKKSHTVSESVKEG